MANLPPPSIDDVFFERPLTSYGAENTMSAMYYLLFAIELKLYMSPFYKKKCILKDMSEKKSPHFFAENLSQTLI